MDPQNPPPPTLDPLPEIDAEITVCPVPPGTSYMNFAVQSDEVDKFTMVYFSVTPAGHVVDPNVENNRVEVEVEPAA